MVAACWTKVELKAPAAGEMVYTLSCHVILKYMTNYAVFVLRLERAGCYVTLNYLWTNVGYVEKRRALLWWCGRLICCFGDILALLADIVFAVMGLASAKCAVNEAGVLYSH